MPAAGPTPPPAPEQAPRPTRPPADRLGTDGTLAGELRSFAGAFEEAATASGLVEHRVRLGGAVVRLRFAGTSLAGQLSRAFAHRADRSDDPPTLTISSWDSGTSGTEPPPLPATEADMPRGAVVYAAEADRHVAYRPGLEQLSAYDGHSGDAWFWCRDARELPFWDEAAPFRQILHWWFADRGLMLLHGAAVGLAAGGVLLVGRGGSGKSTCAMSSLTSNLTYAGDDYVGVALDPEPRVFSLYCSGKLQPGHAKLLRHLPTPDFAGDGTPEEKAVFYVGDRFPERMSTGFPLRAVVVPRVTGALRPRVHPATAADALRALAPSTLLQLVPARPEALTAMRRLLEVLPAYSLELGADVGSIPGTIEALLRDLQQ
jgi:hypothetical protein